MNIQNISKEKRNVIVELEADDLVMICNALYSQLEEKNNNDNFLQLYSDMMMARDLCQYGHIDNFCLSNIVKCRNCHASNYSSHLRQLFRRLIPTSPFYRLS